MIKMFSLFLFTILIFQGCADYDRSGTPEELAKYFSDKKDGLKPVQKHGLFKFEVSYRPAELLELMNNPGITQARLDTIRKQNKDKAYFVCRIFQDSSAITDYLKKTYNDKYDSIWTRLLFHLQPSFHLMSGKKEVPCSFYEVEQTGNISPALTFDLTFETPTDDLSNDWKLVFNDSLISKSSWTVPFDKKYINKIPKIKLSKNKSI